MAGCREVGRKLSGLRDAQAMMETLEALDKGQANGALTDVHACLRERKEKIVSAARGSGEIQSVVEQLEETRKRLQQVSLDIDFRILADSVKTTLKRGKEAFRTAYADPRPRISMSSGSV